MPYLGTPPQSGFITSDSEKITGQTTNYVNLSNAISSLDDVQVHVNYVIQDPSTLSLTSSTRIGLGDTLVSSDVVLITYLGKSVATQSPPVGGVTNDMLAGSITGAKLSDSTITSSKIASGVIPTSRPNVNPIIINGNMAVAQRGTSVTGKTSTDIYTVDRMSAVIGSIGTYTIAQESQTSGNAINNGFANAWRIDCTTADASPSASDQLQMQYTFEGQDLQLFKKGTSNAEKFTLAFWVKSNKTGTGNIQLKDKDNSNRQCTQSYTISSANTWEHKVCVFGADTTGAFDDDNAKSLIINWWLGSGTDSSSGTANHGVWEAQDNTKVNSGGTLNINDNTANDWSITGIQLEVGEYTSSTLPPFQHESYADNLDRCHRYYISYGNVGTNQSGFPARAYSGSGLMWAVTLPKPLRASPTVTLTGTIRAFGSSNTHDSTSAFGVMSYANTNSTIVMLQSTGFSGLSNDRSYNVMSINDTFYTLNAEL